MAGKTDLVDEVLCKRGTSEDEDGRGQERGAD